jgi:hypothetical protein
LHIGETPCSLSPRYDHFMNSMLESPTTLYSLLHSSLFCDRAHGAWWVFFVSPIFCLVGSEVSAPRLTGPIFLVRTYVRTMSQDVTEKMRQL